MDPGITFSELLQYTERETHLWKDWFAAHPHALDLPCDIAGAGTVRGLLLHIFATELFFARAVLDLSEPDWKNLPSQTLDQLFGVSDDAHQKFHDFLADAQRDQWEEVKDLGHANLKASKRKMVAQALLHGIHHRAQLATFLRQHGLAGLWVHDLLLTSVMP